VKTVPAALVLVTGTPDTALPDRSSAAAEVISDERLSPLIDVNGARLVSAFTSAPLLRIRLGMPEMLAEPRSYSPIPAPPERIRAGSLPNAAT